MRIIDIFNETKEKDDSLFDRSYIDFVNEKAMVWDSPKEKRSIAKPKLMSLGEFSQLLSNTKIQERTPNFMVPNYKKESKCKHGLGLCKVTFEEIGKSQIDKTQWICNNCGEVVHEM